MQKLLPSGLEVDLFQGKAYIGVVALSENGIQSTFLPRWLSRWFAMSHHGVNVRTYVRYTKSNHHNDNSEGGRKHFGKSEGGRQRQNDGTSNGNMPGIFFFTLDCSNLWPILGARLLFNFPYRLAWIKRYFCGGSSVDRFRFNSRRLSNPKAILNVEWEISKDKQPQKAAEPGSIASFFVERYCLYHRPGIFLKLFAMMRGNELWRGRITHQPWPLHEVKIVGKLQNSVVGVVPGLGGTMLCQEPIVHFSFGTRNIHFFFEKP